MGVKPFLLIVLESSWAMGKTGTQGRPLSCPSSQLHIMYMVLSRTPITASPRYLYKQAVRMYSSARAMTHLY